MLGLDDILSLVLGRLSHKDVCLQDQHGETALHKAAYHSREASVEMLVTRMEPSDLALVNTVDRTALHSAVRGRNVNIVRLLARNMRPEDLAIQDDSGSTALAWCAEQGEDELVKVLVSHMTVEGGSRQGHDGNTALHLAAYYAEQRCVDILLSSTPEYLALANKIAATPLHIALSNGERHGKGAINLLAACSNPQTNELVARSLLARMDCKDIGVQDSNQRTSIHLALTKGFYSIVLSLLDNSEHVLAL